MLMQQRQQPDLAVRIYIVFRIRVCYVTNKNNEKHQRSSSDVILMMHSVKIIQVIPANPEAEINPSSRFHDNQHISLVLC